MSSELEPAWGGIVVNAHGLLLLSRPANGFDGMAWTFPKGRVDPGETPEACARREVLEETGVRAEVVAALPGFHDGTTTRNGYLLMRALETGLPFDDETEAIAWATPAAAAKLLSQSVKPVGRARDLAVLQAALAALEGR